MSLFIKLKTVLLLTIFVIMFANYSVFAQEDMAPSTDNSLNASLKPAVIDKSRLDTDVDQNNVNIKKGKATYGKNLSIIEEIYNGQLRQFGYDLFGSSASLSSGMASSGGYTIQRGDKVKLYFWGDSLEILKATGNPSIEPIIDAVVNKNGELFIPGIGVIYAEGNSLSGIESDINAELSARFANVQVKVNIDDPRNFPVVVTGKVQKPGTVFVNESSSILDAINFAGGIKRIGSLREIIHIDAYTKKKTVIDLYDLI